MYLVGESRYSFAYRLLAIASGIGSIILAGIIGRKRSRSEGLIALILFGASYPLLRYLDFITFVFSDTFLLVAVRYSPTTISFLLPQRICLACQTTRLPGGSSLLYPLRWSLQVVNCSGRATE
jgi:hypothetical protein